MAGQPPVKRHLVWLTLICTLGMAYYLLLLATVEETHQQVLRDEGRLRVAGAIFPIGHYVVKGVPGPIYKDRLDLAAALWRETPRPVWLLGGGQEGGRESVASVGKRYLIGQGIPFSAITTVDDFPQRARSLDTTEEIGIAARLAKDKGISTIVVVGELMHLAQARLVLDSYGVHALLASTPERRYGIHYQISRVGALAVTLIDRKGLSLFWLRWIRQYWPNWPWGEF